MTFGAGGHSQSLLAVCPRIRLFALDRDVVANSLAVQLANTQYVYNVSVYIFQRLQIYC